MIEHGILCLEKRGSITKLHNRVLTIRQAEGHVHLLVLMRKLKSKKKNPSFQNVSLIFDSIYRL